MAVVSKFLDDAINRYEQLGYSKLRLSQGIVGTCLCAYVLRFTYPLLRQQYDHLTAPPPPAATTTDKISRANEKLLINNNNSSTRKCRQNKERLGSSSTGSSDAEDDLLKLSSSGFGGGAAIDQVLDVKKQIEEAEALLANAKRKERANHIGLNREFLIQLRQLFHIMVPRLWCREMGLLGVHTLCLVSRTFLSIYVAAMEGALVKFIVRKDVKNFLIMLLKWFGIAIPATFVNSMIRFLECKLALSFRCVFHSFRFGKISISFLNTNYVNLIFYFFGKLIEKLIENS